MNVKSYAGIYGGSFDPPHLGHLNAVNVYLNQFGGMLTVMPCHMSPFKTKYTVSDFHRFNMVKLAFGDIKSVFVSDLEINANQTSYTCETIRHYKQKAPDVIPRLVVGTDAFMSLESWRESEFILRACAFAVIARENGDKTEIKNRMKFYSEKYGTEIDILNCTPFKASSTEIRLILSEGKRTELLSESVSDYIERNGLYKEL